MENFLDELRRNCTPRRRSLRELPPDRPKRLGSETAALWPAGSVLTFRLQDAAARSNRAALACNRSYKGPFPLRQVRFVMRSGQVPVQGYRQTA